MNKPKERCYFNVEITYSKTALVINASKKGIDAFLHTYGGKQPPREILLEPISRPQSCWTSWKLSKNPDALPTDPTYYMTPFPEARSNDLAQTLRIDLHDDSRQRRVMYAYLDGKTPVLTVNAEGWQLFLRMLTALRDKSDWFYVTRPNGPAWEHLPFLLSEPPAGKTVFDAIECIRLEPEPEVSLWASFELDHLKSDDPDYFCGKQCIGGNSAGLLLFSDWMEGFSKSHQKAMDIQHPSEKSRIHLRLVGENSKVPLISFESLQDGSSDLYIYGNQAGFTELAEITESYAFSTDHDSFLEKTPEKRLQGDTTPGVLGPKGSCSLDSWEVIGGCLLFKGKYAPQVRDLDEKKNFINQRIIKNDIN